MRKPSVKSAAHSRRVGFGEYADPRGVIPLLIGRVQYLEALASEYPDAIEQLRPIWFPAIAAFSQHQTAIEALAASSTIEPVPAFDQRWAAAIMAPLIEVLGFPLDEIAEVPIHVVPRYPSLPSDSPVMAALVTELELTLRRLGQWMRRWGLPDQDIGWCCIVTCWALVTAAQEFTNFNQHSMPPELPSDDGVPTMGLLDPLQLKTVFDQVLPFLNQLPAQGDPAALGEWLAGLIDSLIGRAQPITIPTMTWHPRVEPRAVAEARLVAEAKRLIKEQLDATDAQLVSAGAKRTPVKTTGLEHYRWLALYQVREKSQRAIAKEVFLTREAVRNALTETANSIDLPLRAPANIGRPGRNKRKAAA